jgi:hypothetical protein
LYFCSGGKWLPGSGPLKRPILKQQANKSFYSGSNTSNQHIKERKKGTEETAQSISNSCRSPPNEMCRKFFFSSVSLRVWVFLFGWGRPQFPTPSRRECVLFPPASICPLSSSAMGFPKRNTKKGPVNERTDSALSLIRLAECASPGYLIDKKKGKWIL